MIETVGPPYPSLQRARFAQLILMFVGLFSTMDLQVVGLLIEPMKHELGLSDLQLGLAHGTAFFAAYGLLAVPAGMLVDRVARVRLVLVAMLLLCAGLMLTGLSHSLWMLILSKLVMGAGCAIVYPAAMSLLADFFSPEKRAFGTASFPVGQQLGQVGALLGGGLGYSVLVGMVATDPDALGGMAPWRMISLLFATIGVLMIPLILAMREPARMETSDAGNGSFRALWEYRRFLIPLFAAIMCLSGLGAGIGTWFAPALMRLYQLQPGDFAMASSAIMLTSGLLSLVIASKLINVVRMRRGDRALMIAAAIFSALCIPGTFMGMMPSVTGFAVLGTLYQLCGGVAIAIPVLVINFKIPNDLRGLCMGTYVVLVAVAGMFGAPLVGYVSQILGGDVMIGHALAAVSAPFGALAALSFWIAGRDQSAVAQTSDEHIQHNDFQSQGA